MAVSSAGHVATKVLTKVINKLWLLVAVLLLLTALLLSALRFTLPYLDTYRPNIENWIYETYEQSVEIGALNARWGANGPELVLEQLNFAMEDNIPVRFSMGKLHVAVRFWESLFRRQLILEDLIFDEVELEIKVQPSQGESLPFYDALHDLLFVHLTHFQLRNSKIHVIDRLNEVRTLRVNSLQWLNKDNKRQATGRFRIPEVTTNHLNFIVDLEDTQSKALTGSLYVKANKLDISPWLKALTHTAEIDLAEFNLEGWLDFKENQFTQGQVHFSENFLEWHRDETMQHKLRTSANTWLLTPLDGGWLMNSEPFEVVIDEQTWPIEGMVWQYQAGEHLWNMHEIGIRDFGPLWSLFGSPGETVRYWSEGLQPQGTVEAFKVRLTQAREWQFYAAASGLSWQPFSGIPGIGGLHFELWSTPYQGRFLLHGQDLNFDSPVAYAEAQQVGALNWQGFWERGNEHWILRMPDGTLSVSGIEFVQDFRLSATAQAVPDIEWAVRSFPSDIEAIDALPYLPLQLGDALNHYLKEAIQAGRVEQLGMLWRGSLGDFPYHLSDSVFLASAKLQAVDFKFQPDWPLAHAEQVFLDYDRDTLTIQAPTAQLMNMQAKQVQVQLPQLLEEEHWLYVDAEVAGTAADATDFFQHSPLADSVGATLEQLVANGDLTGRFHLGIPFFDADFVMKGKAVLAPQEVYIQALNQSLEAVSGQLTFEGETLYFKADTAKWQGLPIALEVRGNPLNAGYQVDAQLQAQWQGEQLAAAFPEAVFLKSISGALSTEAGFVLNLSGEDRFDYRWQMQTNSTSLTSKLPAPLHKRPGEIRFLSIDLQGNEQALNIQAELDKAFQAQAHLALGDKRFTQVQLKLGDYEQITQPIQSVLLDSGTQIYAKQNFLDGNAWGQLIAASMQETQASTEQDSLLDFFPPLNFVAIQAEALKLGHQIFEQANGEFRYEEQGWQGVLDANETRMQMHWQNTAEANQIKITADFLELSEWKLGENEITRVESDVYQRLTSLPRVEFLCRICRYAGQDLGRVTFAFEPNKNGAQLPYLRVVRPGLRAELSGGWESDSAGPYRTQVQVDTTLKNVSSLLSEWGLNSVVRDSELQAQAQFNWPGGPLDMQKKNLSGTARFDFGAGYLRDVSDGGARVLSVLSLESIVRKLTLDFRDLFSRGLFYSRLQGDLNIEKGVVSTPNTELIGAVGDLVVEGQTDLTTETLDYQISLTPKVTSSLPVLVAWMVNPPSGLAALFIDKVLQETKVISRLQYELTGTLSEPVVNEIRRDSKPVGDDYRPEDLVEGENFEQLE